MAAKVELSDRISARDMLYCACITCEERICWRIGEDGYRLVAFCCLYLYVGDPLHDGNRFHLTARKAELKNVIAIAGRIPKKVK